jgi:hypothetical protein
MSKVQGVQEGSGGSEGKIDVMGLLWFRRSKPKEAPQRPEPELPPVAPIQARVPLRLRGVLLLNLKPTDGPEQIEKAPPLGRKDEVVMALHGVAPGMTFDANGKGELIERDHRLTVDIGTANPVPAAVATAEGEAAVEILRMVMEREGWRAYVPKSGVFVEPDALDLFSLSDDLTQSRF